MQYYEGATFQEEYDNDSTISSQETVNSPRSAEGANREKNLGEGIFVGALSIQLLEVDTLKAL
jgi:hypothetical protein